MSDNAREEDDFARRLPLPLSQLYRRAENAKSSLERHLAAFRLWEAGLKLLASVSIAEYARHPQPDPKITEALKSLARPSLGHFWQFVRLLVPVLASQGDVAFARTDRLLFGPKRDDLPRLTGMYAAVRERLEEKPSTRATVGLQSLFDLLVQYRNKVIGHGVPEQLSETVNDLMARALLAGLGELFQHLDVLVGRRLVYVSEVRQVGGQWLVQRLELASGGARRIASLELPRSASTSLPDAERLHLELRPAESPQDRPSAPQTNTLWSLHPLLIYQPDTEEVLFLNSRSGQKRIEYLSYATGQPVTRTDFGSEQRRLLAHILGTEVTDRNVVEWAESSLANEPAEEITAGAAANTLGDFELIRELGRGAMGVVYRARQPSMRRQVAVKRLLEGRNEKNEQRFRREIRALGRLEHPHVVKIYTWGADADRLYYSMELVEGAPLSAVCDCLQTQVGSADALDTATWHNALSTVCDHLRQSEKPLSGEGSRGSEPAATVSTAAEKLAVANPPPAVTAAALPNRPDYVRNVVELLRQTAEGAHALHTVDVIHRDIKPANIMVTSDGTRAVLMDLGLAQLADDEEGRLTRTRQFVGTLRYASPEQVMAVGTLDPRSDVYSLGATLWELLTLHPLFDATEQIPTPKLMQQIIQDEPAPIRKYHPGLPPDLQSVVHKCLEKKPENRYASAQDLADDLGRFLAGEPVRARPVGRIERGLRWTLRHPAKASAMGLTLLTVVLGLLGVSFSALWLNAERARRDLNVALVQLQESKDKEAAAYAALAASRLREAESRAQLEKQKVFERQHYIDTIQYAARAWNEGSIIQAREALADCSPAYRNWEWSFLNRLFHQEQATFAGHTHECLRVVFSPHGKRLASAGRDGTARLWDVAGGKEIATLKGHTAIVWGVAFSPDGQRLATACDDKTARLWDANSGKELALLDSHTGTVSQAEFSPDGKLLATASGDRTIKLWDPTSGKELATLTGHVAGVYHLAFSPDSRLLASASTDTTARLWDMNARKEIATLRGHSSGVNCVAFSPGGNRLATGSDDQTAKLWDVAGGKELLTLEGSKEGIHSIAFDPEGTQLATSGRGNKIHLWDTASGREIAALAGHTHSVYDLAFSPDGQRLASAGLDGTVKLWNAKSGNEIAALQGHIRGVNSVAFSPDGRWLASAGSDHTLKLWDALSRNESAELHGSVPQGYIENVVFSPDGRRLAAASYEGNARVWDTPSGAEVAMLRGHVKAVHRVTYSGDGLHLATASKDGTLKLWDAASGQETATLEGHEYEVNCVAFSPDAKRLVSGGEDLTVRLWEVASGKLVATLEGHKGRVIWVAFSPDGRQVASAGADNVAKLWDVASGREIATLEGHAKAVSYLTYSPNGRRLATASEDGTARVWNTADGKQVFSLEGHTDEVTHLAFSPDGQRLASASLDNTVKLWDLAGGMEIGTLRGHSNGVLRVNFSPDGQRLVSGARDHAVKLWETNGGKELLTLQGHHNPVNEVIFSPDGQRIASAGYDGDLRLWIARETDNDRAIREQVAWRGQASLSEQARNWFAAVFFLTELMKEPPPNAELFQRRGDAYAEQSHWSAAIAELSQACELHPKQADSWYALGLAKLASGDEAGYRATCAAMEPFASSDDPLARDDFVYLCALRPAAVKDAAKLVQVAIQAADADSTNLHRLEVLGAALYRAGSFAQAKTRLQDALKRSGDCDIVWTQFFLAMTCHHLNDTQGSADSLRNALFQSESQFNWTWQRRARAAFLKQEALEVIKPAKEGHP